VCVVTVAAPAGVDAKVVARSALKNGYIATAITVGSSTARRTGRSVI